MHYASVWLQPRIILEGKLRRVTSMKVLLTFRLSSVNFGKEIREMKFSTVVGKWARVFYTHRLTQPKVACKISQVHKRLSKINSKDAVDTTWNAWLTSSPIHSIIKNVTTFASRRYLCDRYFKWIKIFKECDVVMLDKMQDLSFEQEKRLIW